MLSLESVSRDLWTQQRKRYWFLFAILLATCFSVFALPFLLPPPVLPIVSAANAAGFNNKIAAISLACMSVLVFLVALGEPPQQTTDNPGEYGPMPRGLVLLVCLLPLMFSGILCLYVVASDARYGDLQYFIEQIQKHQDYGRQLYSQIEFPYGPLMFYVPAWIKGLLAPIGMSTRGAYIISLLVEQFAGALLLAWILESLPITRTLKLRFFLLCAIGWFDWGLGLNYTMLRFTAPLAILIFTAKQNKVWRFAGIATCGQALCLAISPEMGFAFMSATLALAIYLGFTEGWLWWPGVMAPVAGVAGFLAIAGPGYLHMLNLFAKGVYNFIVEPSPYVLIFVIATVFIVPLMLARVFVLRSPAFPVMGAIYVFSLALLPVAFGRADSAHIFYNGIGLYVLSMVAVSTFRLVQPRIWLVCVIVISLYPQIVSLYSCQVDKTFVLRCAASLGGDRLRRWESRSLERLFPAHTSQIRSAYDEPEPANSKPPPLDVSAMERITGKAPVATPYEISNGVEASLKRSGHYVPLFYDFQIAILDRSAEEREVSELRQYEWILIPSNEVVLQSETPQSADIVLGIKLPYAAKNKPYEAGRMLVDEISRNWQVAGVVGAYKVYHKRSAADF